MDALEMTTWELMDNIERRRDIDGELRELIRVFLENCDLVKFAKYKPQIVEINGTFNRAYEIIEKSRPRGLSQPAESSEQVNGETATVAPPAGEEEGS
jgi:hypothetical protein